MAIREQKMSIQNTPPLLLVVPRILGGIPTPIPLYEHNPNGTRKEVQFQQVHP